MRFFTPRAGQRGHDRLSALWELVGYEYFEPAPENPEYDAKAALFKDELDFAWFVVKFGWSKDQYNQLTPVERLFIKKQHETELVERQRILQSTFELAIGNVLRKKGKKYKKLFKKIKKMADEEAPVSKDEMKKLSKALAKLIGIPKPNK